MQRVSPRALLLASLALAAATAGAGVLLVRPAPAPPPPAPFTIVGAAARAGAYGATLTWSTPADATAVVTWGPSGAVPLLWSPPQSSARSHVVRLDGLAAASPYTATIAAVSDNGDTASTEVTFTTAPAPSVPVGSVRDGLLRAAGAPLFPLMTWEECPDRWAPDVADGIDLFGGNPCTGLGNLLAAVQGRALVAGTTDDVAGTTGPGLVGWFYPDEADARGYTGETLPAAGAGVRFLTLTSHFATAAAPLPEGRSVYPGLIARADVVGFDLYPLQELCRPDLLPAVFDAQAELVRLAWPRPTFQWIEERAMKCPQPEAAVTPATIRVESWLAIAGGAQGLGFFPPDWHTPVGPTIRGIADQVRQLEPALLRPVVPVAVAGSADVRASARVLNGAVYLIAVNPATVAAQVTLTAEELGDRTFDNGSHAAGGRLSATLPPRSVLIAVSPPVS